MVTACEVGASYPPMRSSGVSWVRVALACLACLASVSPTHAGEDTHTYAEKEPVVLWLNKIGPYHNPQETYTYYSLPFCIPEGNFHTRKKYVGIGEILEGNDLMQSAMIMNFGINVPRRELCSQTLTAEEATTFKYAISQHYWYQLFIDDLPVWGMVGEIAASKEELEELEKDTSHEHAIMPSHIFTHKAFTIGYNGNQIIEVNLSSRDRRKVEPNVKLTFSYSVEWVPVKKAFNERFNRYLDYSFFEHQIHWFSIFNAFMMVVFLCGLVSLILMRTLKNDLARYDSDREMDGLDRDFGDDSGWKQIHGDVFRRPPNLILYAACFGAGMQMTAMVLCVILMAIAGSLYVDPGALISATLVSYAATSIVSGYSSAVLYQQYFVPKKGPKWIICMIITALLLPSVCLFVVLMLNAVSIYHGTQVLIPTGALVYIILIWSVVALPLHILGTIIGRNWGVRTAFPCRVNALPRQIPEQPWYTKHLVIIPLAGWLPYGAIFIEMYFILTSFWAFKLYYVFGFLFVVYLILIIVTGSVTVVATYFMLNHEDYRWQWCTFYASGSTSFYVWCYSLYFYQFKTNMTGSLQLTYYLMYMTTFCLALGLMTASIGTAAATLFVKRIYHNIHVD